MMSESVYCHQLLDNINKRLNLQRHERRWPTFSELGQSSGSNPGASNSAQESHIRAVGSFPDVSDSFNFSGLSTPSLPPPPPPPVKAAFPALAQPEPKAEETTELRRRSNINMGLEVR